MANSKVEEDFGHAKNTYNWLLKLNPESGEALRIAALAHDIDRAIESRKVQRSKFKCYDAFKAAHAKNSAKILSEILKEFKVPLPVSREACRLVVFHEVGGDPASDLLKDADSISYFDFNLPFYFKREGWEETLRRAAWGFQRLSLRGKRIVGDLEHKDEIINCLLKEVSGQH